jgi:hypothetical protein
MSNEFDNRRSFRVSEAVYLKYDVISELEFEQGLNHRKLALGVNDGAQSRLSEIESRLSEAMYLLNTESDKIGRCLTLLNDKLNVAISQLPALRETKAAIAKETPQTCDVSADGLVFSSARPLDPGTRLHLRALLSSDNRFIESFGTVVRLTDPPDNQGGKLPYGIGLEFNGMKPELRELLIQHMFNLESETLRMRRLKLDEFGKPTL